MQAAKFRSWPLTVILLTVVAVVAFYIRAVLPHAAVFSGPWIKLTGIDAYFYMRLVDNLVRNFPNLISFDPYFIYPGGGYPGEIRFFALMMAGTIRLLGGAAPAQQVVDTIAVYIPAVMGTLLVIPAFFIGRALANRWAGLAAAAAVAVMPGELLGRTLLGATDHHVAEVFFSTFFVMFFVLALGQGRQFTWAMLGKGQLNLALRDVPHSIMAGLFLGLYMISWRGSLFFLFIAFIFFIVQFISDHLRGLPTDYLGKTAIICFVTAVLIYFPVSLDTQALLALAVLILLPPGLNIFSRLMAARGLRPAFYPAAIIGLLAIGMLAAWLIFPDLFRAVIDQVTRAFSWNIAVVESESRPLLLRGGRFSLDTAWAQYALALYSGLAGLAVLILASVRRGQPVHIFTAAWSVVMILACFAMVRQATYLAVCLAVLTGYFAGLIIEVILHHKRQAAGRQAHKKARRAGSETAVQSGNGRTAALLAVIAAAIAFLAPGTASAVSYAANPASAPGDAYMEAFEWLRKNSPEPFGNTEYYYAPYGDPRAGKSFSYPDAFYSVITWCDYGYWLTRVGRRVPQSNPGQAKEVGAAYFSKQDEAGSAKMMDDLRARYVVVDDKIASPVKFFAAASLSGINEADFYERCFQKRGDRYEPVVVIYPAYYRSMVSRLYSFDGREVTPASSMVMEYLEGKSTDGKKVKEITGVRNFNSYAEAEAFLASQKQGSCRIIGTDPLASPVPLEALQNYRLVYQSTQKGKTGSTPLAAVKIFEYTR